MNEFFTIASLGISLTGRDAISLQFYQDQLAAHLELADRLALSRIKTVAGVDLAYWQEAPGHERAVCCIVVMDISSGQVLEKQFATGAVLFAYMPGFLSFRELPLIAAAAEKLAVSPDVYMFDGNGQLHPRRMGIASQASFHLQKPTLGVAKSYYKINGMDFTMPENETGAYTEILCDNVPRGRAVRTHKDVRPVFVSPGNWMSLDTATQLTLRLTGPESHIPMPTRLADIECNAVRRKIRA